MQKSPILRQTIAKIEASSDLKTLAAINYQQDANMTIEDMESQEYINNSMFNVRPSAGAQSLGMSKSSGNLNNFNAPSNV